ncbi:MAG TPA: pilus assembly protein PilM, partial [Thermoguttaceae bacterium]
KLTFAKAEHLKRNATAAADPKAVFQAMRPVFNDLLTQLQRSIGYFSNIDRAAKIGRIVALGSAMKLPGLRRYLSQSLGYEIQRVESFQGLVGSQVLSSPVFQENTISFGVCYGLALQGLGQSGIHTNLLPKEIVKDRLIKSKKPWTLAAVASLLLACGISFGAYSWSMGSVDAGSWKPATDQANQIIQLSTSLKSQADAAINDFNSTDQIGQHLVGNVEGRLRWLELMKALNACLPADEAKEDQSQKNTDADALYEEITNRNRLQVINVDCQYCQDVSTWFSAAKRWYQGPDVAAESGGGSAEGNESSSSPDEQPAEKADAASPADSSAAAGQSDYIGPSGPGWIIKLQGYHYHNTKKAGYNLGAQFVHNTLIDKLLNGTLKLPNVEGQMTPVTMRELGISYPVLIDPKKVEDEEMDNPYTSSENTPGAGRLESAAGARRTRVNGSSITLPRFNFTVHFCWQPKTPSERQAAKEGKLQPQQTSGGEDVQTQP